MRNFLKPAAIAALNLSLFAIPGQAAVISADSAVLFELPGESRTVISGPSGPGLSAASYTSPTGSAASSGFGHADYGALHASAAAIINAGSAGGTTEVRGQSGALWLDQVTISSATLTGAAFARVSFSLMGSLSSVSDLPPGGAMANASAIALVRVNGASVFRAKGQLVSENGVITLNELAVEGQLNGAFFELDPGSSLSGSYTFDIPFTFGTSFQLFGTLNTLTQTVASTGRSASAHSNFGSSAYWGGISAVHLADGTILNGYDIGSDSGTDWGDAYISNLSTVPAPAAIWLLGSGLGGMTWLRRRKA